MKKFYTIIFVILFYCVPQQVSAQANKFVDSLYGNDANTGNTWAAAYKTLDKALTEANLSTTIKTISIAKGTYFPGNKMVASRDTTFLITRSDLKIYGGFPNGGGTKDPIANSVILSGDIGTSGVKTDNVNHVMVIVFTGSTVDSIFLEDLNFTLGYSQGSTGNRTYNGQNIARRDGAALYAFTFSANRVLKLNKCNFYENNARSNGTIRNRAFTSYFDSCTFSNNVAVNGGAMYANRASSARAYINNCTFFNNNASNNGASIYANTLRVAINHSNFSYDTAVNGASIFNNSNTNLTINASVFKKSFATTSGGAIYNNTSNNFHLTGCHLDSNTTGTDGGGIYIRNSNNALLDSNYFTFNKTTNATSRGGAVRVQAGSNFRAVQCLFQGNSCASTSATNNGGALTLVNTSSPIIVNNIFSGNTSANFGGAMFVITGGGNTNIMNNTYSGNSAVNGAGIYFTGTGTINFRNNILYGNSSDIHKAASSTPNVEYSIIESGYVGGTAISTSDPLFFNAPSYSSAPFVGGDYHVNFCSPALDNGNIGSFAGTIGTVDVVGLNRTVGTIDIGAYEKQSSTGAGTFTNNIALSRQSSNGLVFPDVCDDLGWTYYTDPNNSDSLSFGILWGATNNAAKAAAQIYLNVDTGNRFVTDGVSSANTTMKRFWNVDLGATSLVDSVSVRFFFDPADTVAMRNTLLATGLSPVWKLLWFKTKGVFFDPATVTTTDINGGNTYALTAYTYGTLNGVHYVEFTNVGSFSGGTAGMGAGSASPLPLNLLSFTAQVQEPRAVKVKWQTAQEKNIKQYEVQRSADGINWNVIANVPAQATGSNQQDYQITDYPEYQGQWFYKLKIVEQDAQVSYSPTAKVLLQNKSNSVWQVYPNPAKDYVVIENAAVTNAQFKLLNSMGQVVNSNIQIENGQSRLELSTLSNGIYFIMTDDMERIPILISK